MSFTRKDNSLHLLRQIRIESHFSTEIPIQKSYLNHHLTALRISQHHDQQKTDVSSAKSFVVDYNFLLKLLICKVLI